MIICNECHKEIKEDSIPLTMFYPYNSEWKNKSSQDVVLCPECFKKCKHILCDINLWRYSKQQFSFGTVEQLVENNVDLPLITFLNNYKHSNIIYEGQIIDLTTKYSGLFLIYNKDKFKCFIGYSTNVVEHVKSLFNSSGNIAIYWDYHYLRNDFTIKIMPINLPINSKEIKEAKAALRERIINMKLQIEGKDYHYLHDKLYNKKL